jgi:hypothetical protein
MKGIVGVIDRLRKEVRDWFAQRKLDAAGPKFVRFHVIDRAGEMAIEVGISVAAPAPVDGHRRHRPRLARAGGEQGSLSCPMARGLMALGSGMRIAYACLVRRREAMRRR